MQRISCNFLPTVVELTIYYLSHFVSITDFLMHIQHMQLLFYVICYLTWLRIKALNCSFVSTRQVIAWKDLSPEWPIMCRVGCKTLLTHSLTELWCLLSQIHIILVQSLPYLTFDFTKLSNRQCSILLLKSKEQCQCTEWSTVDFLTSQFFCSDHVGSGFPKVPACWKTWVDFYRQG